MIIIPTLLILKIPILIIAIKVTISHLAPLKRVINDKNVDTKRPIRPGTISNGIKTEAAEARLSIMLGMKVCRK